MSMKEDFLNPPNQFRPIPFWSWNDQLEKEEIIEQIKELKKGGNGGFFMHARSGLKTKYLSEEWFEAIKTGIETAKKEQMNAWIYDEEGWPSGFAGGLVPEHSKDFHAKFITMKECASLAEMEEEKLLACYQYNVKTKTYERLFWDSFEMLRKGEVYREEVKSDSELMSKTETVSNTELEEVSIEATFILIYKHSIPFYIDTLNKRAIEYFLQCTHEAYYERFGESFGSDMLGFFTDEPRLTCNNFGDIAWSDDLPEVFQERHGYDIRNYLPALFGAYDNYEKYRYDFWETVSYMFSEHYMKTIYDWCETHHCKVTGHIMMEESIFSQMTSTAGVMPFYEYMHIPGIDWLRRRIDSPVIGKQVGSVACQLGKKQILTESFALCGWNVSFEELKWIAEWQFVNGVNQICQHLMGYTIKGVRKRDYPPSHFTQQSWWESAAEFNDYLGRLCVALSEGNQTADVVLLHPMRSGFISYDGTRTKEIRQLDDDFTKASECLSGLHISYHYGDETILQKHGSIENGLLRIGLISYKTVILPSMYAIDVSTLALLLAFSKEGGTIFSLGELPHFTNGTMEQLEALQEVVIQTDYETIRSQLEEKKLITLSIQEHGHEVEAISYLQRETKEGTLYFLVNHDQENVYETTLRFLGQSGRVWQFIPETGEQIELPLIHINMEETLSLVFQPMQSYLLLLQPETQSIIEQLPVNKKILYPNSDWNIKEMSMNSYTLDSCQYRLEQGEWQPSIATILLQNKLLEMKRPIDVEMKFEFHINMDLKQNREFYLVVEDAEKYQILINQEQVSYEESMGWWKDKSFHKVPIKAHLKNGLNEVIMKIKFQQPQKVYDVLFGENVYETEKNKITYDIELESIYLVGDFGVVSKVPFQNIERKAMLTDGPFEIVDAPTHFTTNDFTTQGLLFFAGKLEVAQTLSVNKEEGERIILHYGKHNAPMMKVSVNGTLVKTSLWEPYEVDITEVVKEGKNELTFELYASNRNLLGPHHHIQGECYNVGPESFTGKWSWVERVSESDATDIADRNKSYWNPAYCFVEFGPEQVK